MAANDMSTIYVPLLDEGVDVWRPVTAKELPDGLHEIVSVNTHPSDEKWAFPTGSRVRCEPRSLSDGVHLVAVGLVR